MTPAFTFTATSGYAPTAPPVRQIYYQAHTWTGQWQRATPQGSSGGGTTPALTKGIHILYAFAVDGMEATSINTGGDSSPIPGQMSAYLFLVGEAANLYLPLTMRQ